MQELPNGSHLRKTAIALMKSALCLLDAADEAIAAAHLQHAIDTADHEPVGEWQEEESAEPDELSIRRDSNRG